MAIVYYETPTLNNTALYTWVSVRKLWKFEQRTTVFNAQLDRQECYWKITVHRKDIKTLPANQSHKPSLWILRMYFPWGLSTWAGYPIICLTKTI